MLCWRIVTLCSEIQSPTLLLLLRLQAPTVLQCKRILQFKACTQQYALASLTTLECVRAQNLCLSATKTKRLRSLFAHLDTFAVTAQTRATQTILAPRMPTLSFHSHLQPR
ncbi:hypothetical protein BDR26DRAFT_321522 [Obelidium mucronatum]|nr:hypothetical protein BDR26DRAFT_321522 [Obelidium mucronatum]